MMQAKLGWHKLMNLTKQMPGCSCKLLCLLGYTLICLFIFGDPNNITFVDALNEDAFIALNEIARLLGIQPHQ